MNLEPFLGEQWMTAWENQAVFNMTDTSCASLSMEDILKAQPDLFSNLTLDYGEITGSQRVKRAILSLYETGDEDSITTTAGCLNGNIHAMNALLEPGDHVIAFKPGYEQYVKYPKSIGCTVTEVVCASDGSFTLEDVKAAINEKTKLIVLASPANPTGWQVEDWTGLAQLAREHGIWILCDEVYRGIGKAAPAISDVYEKGISTGSLSKSYGAPAIRFGWVKGPKDLIDTINFRRDYTIISTGPLTDTVAAWILEHSSEILARNNETVRQNKETLSAWLQANPDFACAIPEAGSVAFLQVPVQDTMDFARELVQTLGLFFVPGECFGMPGWFRLGLGREPQMFARGLDMLSNVTKLLKQRKNAPLKDIGFMVGYGYKES